MKEGIRSLENISLGQIATLITFLSIFVGAITSVITFSKFFLKKILNPVNEKIEHLEQISMASRNNIELELIKMILVNFINDVEQGNVKSTMQKQNIYELYERYKTLGGNAYIIEMWDKLSKEGKI